MNTEDLIVVVELLERGFAGHRKVLQCLAVPILEGTVHIEKDFAKGFEGKGPFDVRVSVQKNGLVRPKR